MGARPCARSPELGAGTQLHAILWHGDGDWSCQRDTPGKAPIPPSSRPGPQCVGGQSPWLSSEHLGSRLGKVPRAGAWSQRLSGGGWLVRTVGVCQGLTQGVLAPPRGQKASPHMSVRAPALLQPSLCPPSLSTTPVGRARVPGGHVGATEYLPQRGFL